MSRRTKRDDRVWVRKAPGLVLIHIAYWLLYVMLLVAIFSVLQMQLGRRPPQIGTLMPILILCTVPGLVSFYAHYLLLFPRVLARRRIFALVVFAFMVSLIAAMVGALLSFPFFGFDQAVLSDAAEFVAMIGGFMVLAAIHGALALLIHGFINWFEEMRLKEELASKNLEMELAVIRSQINPHFLFNTINNIDVLIAKDSTKASRYLNKLSDILRYTVYETKAEKIALDLELEYIEKYLELQRIRSANPNYVRFETSGSADGLQIAPMILFPFIENAFKHADNTRDTDAISVRATTEGARLRFECENSYQIRSTSGQGPGGLGNRLIEKRLALLYADKHHLDIEKGEQTYRVQLTIDLDTA